MSEAVLRLAGAMGILPRFTDTTGTERVTGPDTARALLAALGEAVDSDAAAADRLAELEAGRAARPLPDWIVVPAGEAPDIPGFPPGEWRIEREDGLVVEGRGPEDIPSLPLGIHRLWTGGAKTVLLAAPRQLDLPPRSWGLMVPLWGLRGAAAGGVGDFGDLAALGAALAGSGAAFLGINPVHAGFPTDLGAYSPYTPSHRRRLNGLLVPLDVAVSTGPLIDYPAETAARRAALDTEFAAFAGDPDFDAFRADEGPALDRFAAHQALSERHGPYWTAWPAELHDADSPAVARAAAALGPRVQFHAWLQWRAERALAAAAVAARGTEAGSGLYLDLAVGTHPAGAETWEDRRSFVLGASLGAPPDALGPQGQNWNLAPLHPSRLVAQDFAPLAETLRRQFRHCGVLRVDHILGFERAFWVPADGSPGGYVSMPRDAMLAVARIEAARVGGVVVGEDLGVVPEGLRGALAASGIPGCRLAMFEREDGRFASAAAYPEAAIASFSTHDLPTWEGWRRAADLDAWAALGALPDAALDAARAARAADVAAFDAVIGPGDRADALHDFLAQTPSRLVAVQAETVLGVAEQPNLPGTTVEYPNWRRRLPVPAPEMARAPALTETAAIMARHGRRRS